MGTALDIEVRGDDEVEATRAVEKAFASHAPDVPLDKTRQHQG